MREQQVQFERARLLNHSGKHCEDSLRAAWVQNLIPRSPTIPRREKVFLWRR